MSDDCEMCDGQGEIDVPKLDEYGNVPCPECVSRELNARCDRQVVTVAEVTGRCAELEGIVAMLRQRNNEMAFDRSCILRAIDDAAPEDAPRIRSESFKRINPTAPISGDGMGNN